MRLVKTCTYTHTRRANKRSFNVHSISYNVRYYKLLAQSHLVYFRCYLLSFRVFFSCVCVCLRCGCWYCCWWLFWRMCNWCLLAVYRWILWVTLYLKAMIGICCYAFSSFFSSCLCLIFCTFNFGLSSLLTLSFSTCTISLFPMVFSVNTIQKSLHFFMC